MNLHIEMDICTFVDSKPKVKQEPKMHQETGEPQYLAKRKKQANLAESDDDYDPNEKKRKRRTSTDDDEDFNPRNQMIPGSRSFTEQLSIDISIEGLRDSIHQGGPYKCVIPTCEDKVYPTASSLRRHYVTHDPEMTAFLVCPTCRFMKADDHPGDMRKHIMKKHDKDEEWAEKNMILEVSEKLKEFREATGLTSRKGPHKKKIGQNARTRTDIYGVKRRSRPTYILCQISLEDPLIRESFESGGFGGVWRCGVPECGAAHKLAYDLKRHYGNHDKSLRKNLYECNFCTFTSWLPKKMEEHVEKVHQDVLFLSEPGTAQYKELQGEGWVAFSEAANFLVEKNPNHSGRGNWKGERDGQGYELEGEVFETISERCDLCSETFNTRNAFEDHDKVHRPHLVTYACEHCGEGFAVESVYNNHLRSHSVLYDRMKHTDGVIRCNGCSLHFFNISEVKNHLSIHHMNLLENCNFCEHCSEFFLSKSSLQKHMFKHAEEVFKCRVCPGKDFLTSEELDDHLDLNNCKPLDLSFSCNECGAAFPTKQRLNGHLRKKHEKKVYRFQCNICRTLYLNITLMKQHVRKTHKVKTGPINDYYIFYSREEAMLLDVETLNAGKPKGRAGKSTTQRYPCPFNCGKYLKQTGLEQHKKLWCKNKPPDLESPSQDSAYDPQDFQYSFPVAV